MIALAPPRSVEVAERFLDPLEHPVDRIDRVVEPFAGVTQGVLDLRLELVARLAELVARFLELLAGGPLELVELVGGLVERGTDIVRDVVADLGERVLEVGPRLVELRLRLGADRVDGLGEVAVVLAACAGEREGERGESDGGSAAAHSRTVLRARRPETIRSMPNLLLVAATDRELCGHDGLVCGVGPVEAAVATARALALREFAAVLHVGLAGGRGVPVGEIVVGTEAVYCDLSAEWPVVDRVAADARLVAALGGALPDATPLPIHTSAAVGAARDDRSHAPLVEAMEGFGVLRAAARAGVPAVEVRAISNELGEADRARWDLERGLASLGLALPLLVDAVVAATASGS